MMNKKRPGHFNLSIFIFLILANFGFSYVYADQNIKIPHKVNIENTSAKWKDSLPEEKTGIKAEDKSITEFNGNNLFSTVEQGGPLMIFLLLLGIVSLTIIFERIIYFFQNGIWMGPKIEESIRLDAANSRAVYREDLEDELNSKFSIHSKTYERGLTLLSGIGNLAPIVGFLGTVIGMISAFASIATATTVNAKVVAVGIKIALVTTAGGLMVAAPTLAFYYLFNHVIQNRYAHAENIIVSLIDKLPRLSDQVREMNADE